MKKIEHNSLCETESYKVMTDNDIKKALEVCISKPNKYRCVECPLYDTEGNCKWALKIVSLNLINRKDAEIERLNKEVDRLSQCVMYHDGHIVDAKDEAIEEFVKRLKENIYIVFEDTERMRVVQEVTIDNLVKEMTEQSTMGQVK